MFRTQYLCANFKRYKNEKSYYYRSYFIREGNTVGITGRREDKLQEICSQNKNCFYSVSDVTKDTDTVRQLSNLVNRVGGMDILIFCSGIGELNPELDYLLEKPTLLTNVIGLPM